MYTYRTWRWLLWNCNACVCVRALFRIICKTCCVRVLYQISVYHSLLFSCCTRTKVDSSNTHAHTHACLQVNNEEKTQINSNAISVGVLEFECVGMFTDTIITNVKSFDMMAMHMTLTRDDGHKYEISPFLLLSKMCFTQLTKAMCTGFHRHKQIPPNIKLFLVFRICETRILSIKIWRLLQNKLKTFFRLHFLQFDKFHFRIELTNINYF